MYKLLSGMLLLAVTVGCNGKGGGTATTTSATSAYASDSVILTGGQSFLMIHGEPMTVSPTSVSTVTDSVIVVGGQSKTTLTRPIASSTPSSTTSGTTAIACKVVVHDATPATTPPKYVFVVSC